MLLYKLFNNKYACRFHSFVKNICNYGISNTVNMSSRNKNISYSDFKNTFADNKSIKMNELIEKKAGSDLCINTAFDMGYCLFGPVMYEFVEWLYNCSAEYDELWFLSREGWIIKKLFDAYSSNMGNVPCKSKYFLASRRAVSVASIRNEEDIKEILSMYYKGGVENLIKARLGLNVKCDFYVEMPRDIDKVLGLINIMETIEIASSERINYLKYIGKVKGKTAVVDVGYSGTIQYYLSKLTNNKLDGLYLCAHFNNKPKKIGNRCKSLFPVYNVLDERVNKIFKNQLYFEAVMQAPFGQLISFNNNFEPIYNYDSVLNDVVIEAQKGIMEFVRDMGIVKKGKRNTFAIEIFDYGISSKNINKDLFNFFSVEDSYCSDRRLELKNSSWN